jgi:hypothetical protein
VTLPNGYDEQEIRDWKDSEAPDPWLGVVYVDALLEVIDTYHAALVAIANGPDEEMQLVAIEALQREAS